MSRETRDDVLTGHMAQLAAGLRQVVPATDQWEVSMVDFALEEAEVPCVMVQIAFSRRASDRKFSYLQCVSPSSLGDVRVGPEWIGRYMGRKWLRKVSEAMTLAG